MNTDTEPDKLDILPERIIHILLKQLMVMKNELAYINNKMGLNNSDYSATLKGTGIIVENDRATLKGTGIIVENDSATLKGTGIIVENDRATLKGTGIIVENDSATLKGTGIIVENDSATLKGTGIIVENDSATLKGTGINDENDSATLKGTGINNIVEALSVLGSSANAADRLYSVFEQELNAALEQYIKQGNRQNTLFRFYSDFVDAVANKNSLADRIKQAAANLNLEDTRILPAEIPVNINTLALVRVYLHEYVPTNSKPEWRNNVAIEVLYLHNNGKAKQTQLREATGVTVSGFSKHLPKMIKYGLIQELPSKYYALTDKSIHILLKLFGVPKEKE